MVRTLRPSERVLLLTLVDAGAIVLAVGLALYAWSFTSGDNYSLAFVLEHAWWLLAVPVGVTALAPTRRTHTALDLRAMVWGVAQACAALFGAYLVAFFYFGNWLPRLMALYVVWNTAWLTVAVRVCVLVMLTRGRFTRRLRVLGGTVAEATVRELVEAPALADAVVVRDDAADVTEVVVGLPTPLDPALTQLLLRYQEAGVAVTTLERLYESTLLRVPVRHLSEGWLLADLFGGNGLRDASPFAKRLLDVGAGITLGVVTVPIVALAAVAIWLDDRGPVLYRQTRLGRAGQPFTITKLRTMRTDAEAEGPQWSGADDRRLTRVGRWLRRVHLDELPNIWHVVRGEMSLVGPRPERPEFVAQLEAQIPWYRARLIVQPGLTGWAQVNQGYGDSIDAAVMKLEYDLYYIRHRSVWFDLAVLARTAGRILGMKGR